MPETMPAGMLPGPKGTLIPSMAPPEASAQAGTGVAAVRDWPGRAPAADSVEPAPHPVVLRERRVPARRVRPEAVARQAVPRVRQAHHRVSC